MALFRQRWAALAAALMVAVTAATTGVLTQSAIAQVSKAPAIVWGTCEGAPATPARECGTVTVPLDYANPSAGTTNLAVARIRATDPDPAHHKGVLMFMPGGPPSGGAQYVGYTNMARYVTPEVQAAFDVVGFDQIGLAEGVSCLTSDQLRTYWETNHLPKTLEQTRPVVALEETFNNACVQKNPIARFMNTDRSFRDMEMVRAALGADKLSLLSLSYGTALAHGYASRYPSRVRAMVLDSIVDRSQLDAVTATEVHRAWDQAWQRFIDWCQATVTCSLRGRDINAMFDEALNVARTAGIPAPYSPLGNRPVNDWELTLAVQAVTGAGQQTYGWAEAILRDAADLDGNGVRDASVALYLYDALTGRYLDASGNPAYGGREGTTRAFGCNDSTWGQVLTSAEAVRALELLTTHTVAPRFGASSVYQGVAQCYKWPLPPVNPPPVQEVVTSGAPALLVAARYDVSTPLSFAERVQKQMRPGSPLVVVDGASHLQTPKSRCVQALERDYLLSGALPADRTTCTYDPDLNPPQPPPVLGPTAQQSAGAALVSPELQVTLGELRLAMQRVG